MAASSLIEHRLNVSGLSKSFHSTQILDSLNLVAAPGETLAIIGRSGSGKSTLLRCLTLLEQPDEGDIYLDNQLYVSGQQVFYQPWEVRRNIALVFQDFNLFPNMTVLENVAFGLRKTRGFKKNEALDRAEYAAKILGIENVLSRYPYSLSGGQAQRCALARAMVLEPKVFLLDEITSALDPETVLNVVEAIRGLRAADNSGNMVIIVVTHLMHFAENFADRICFLHNGKIHEEMPAREFFRNCAKPETQKFISAFLNSY